MPITAPAMCCRASISNCTTAPSSRFSAATALARPRPCARLWGSCGRALAMCCSTARTSPAGRRTGSPAPGRPHRVARTGVAYVPEGRLIFPDLTVIENIRVAERRPAKSWSLQRLLELFPALRERAGNKGALLSGGEQQMLAIARALVSDPKVLLLDEPSQGLAPLVVRELARVVRDLCESGVTILLIEQNIKLAEEVADRLAIMVKGKIVYSASPAAFRADEESVRRRYLTL